MRVEILIRKKREEKGYTIDELAKIAGMSKGHLSRIERGKTNAKISTLVRIADALEIKTEELYKIYLDV